MVVDLAIDGQRYCALFIDKRLCARVCAIVNIRPALCARVTAYRCQRYSNAREPRLRTISTAIRGKQHSAEPTGVVCDPIATCAISYLWPGA